MLFRSVSQSRYRGRSLETRASEDNVERLHSRNKNVFVVSRKSGDVTTFIGNTIIIAACLSSMLPMERLIKGAFCGDDSILYSPKGTDFPDLQQGANLLWNFEAKLIRKRYGYFCGRYIIHHDRGCIVYYDPLKLISKLSAIS